MILKLFTQPSCPKCPAAKMLLAELKVQSTTCLPARQEFKVEEYDVTTVDGLAEASFYTVMATPSILVFDDSNKKIGDWRGEAPKMEDILKVLQ